MRDLGLREGYAVAFFDVDGTLVERLALTGRLDDLPTAHVCEAIREFVAAGNVAMLSTGRGYNGVQAQMGALPFRGAVAMDGAFVVLDGQVVLDAVMSDEAAQAFYDFVEAEGLTAGFDAQEGACAISPTGRWEGADLIFRSAAEAREALPHPHIQKVNIMGTTAEQMSRLGDAASLFEIFDAADGAFELCAPGVSKGSGIRALMDVLPACHGPLLGVGDSENDLGMFRECDVSIAMGNSPDSVKAVADLVVGDVNHDGVVEALERTRHLWQ